MLMDVEAYNHTFTAIRLKTKTQCSSYNFLNVTYLKNSNFFELKGITFNVNGHIP